MADRHYTQLLWPMYGPASPVALSPKDALEVDILVRVVPAQTHRGCCSRCDACGSRFAHPGDAGCHPGSHGQPSACGQGSRAPKKRRKTCAGCERPYEAIARPRAAQEASQPFLWERPAEEEPGPDFDRYNGGAIRKWTPDPRPHSMPGDNKPLNRRERREGGQLQAWYGQRPRTRAECENVIRPCPFVSCAMNLYLDVDPEHGSIKINHPHLDPTEMVESCALDVSERGGVMLEDLGRILNVSLEGASKVVDDALEEVRAKVSPKELARMVARGKT